ncbi:MetQ/NlpA family ABC transporter substrate-binding protein [Atopobacter phocae]|uniref:MetQ/NlpA family ABC transporter substrate-binding protein n=1 Tax=Atopobacter phocae TaxID=136492 RepID=UPI000470FB44|nr:MetQ/NlpA family ABC transporter substrate-binding protein [Atopobacter phocae]
MKRWKKVVKSILSIGVITCLAACGSQGTQAKDAKLGDAVTVKLGVMGANTDVWDDVKERLKDENITLEYVNFSDYNQPNRALADGSIDLNAFQHQFFLDNYNEEHGTQIVSIGQTINEPMGIYSEQVKEIKQLKKGAKVAIPNDVTNGGRALLLLQTAGLIELDQAAGQTPTIKDIKNNKKQIEVVELDASQTARALNDVDIAVVNSDVAVDAGFIPAKDAIFLEEVNEDARPYINIIASRDEDKDNPIYKKIVEVYQTDETIKVIEQTSKGSQIPAWKSFK